MIPVCCVILSVHLIGFMWSVYPYLQLYDWRNNEVTLKNMGSINCYLKHNTVQTKPCTFLKMYHICHVITASVTAEYFWIIFSMKFPYCWRVFQFSWHSLRDANSGPTFLNKIIWKLITIYLYINFIRLYAKWSQLTINHHWLSKWIRTTLSYHMDDTDKIYDAVII